MRRILLLAFVFLAFATLARADHITGGEIFYRFTGMDGPNYTYNITVRLFMLCSSDRQLENPNTFSIFNKSTGQRIRDFPVSLSGPIDNNLNNSNPCITNPPPVCFRIGTYTFSATLPASAEGYVIAAHVVYRVDGMKNLYEGYNQVGATYTAEIPGNGQTDWPENSSAHFQSDDLVIICANNKFSYDFSASDEDDDLLRYSLCSAYQTSGGVRPGEGSPPPAPPYSSVPYGTGFSGGAPFGGNTSINATTGIVTGIAPGEGTYVLTVCVEEIRDGQVIATQRKDLQINIAPCDVAASSLLPEYQLCSNSTTLNAKNLSTSRLINTYDWTVLRESGEELYASSLPQMAYNFTDTGTYVLRLEINKGAACEDSSQSLVRVYPGFEPGFTTGGTCISRPVQFTDTTRSAYGVVSSWHWDFGQGTVSPDIASEQHPSFQYNATGNKLVTLVVQSSTGCRDTVNKTVVVFDRPPIGLAFRDTLICPPDALPLQASGSGIFSWQPNASLSDPAIAQPVVNPVTNTTYYVTLEDAGCVNTDSVSVRVVDHVSLTTMPDTVICEGDEILIHLNSDALNYVWSPSETLSDAAAMQPFARPLATTIYEVRGFISQCVASGLVQVNTVPYPTANAGPDTLICYNTFASLHASTDGSSYSWVRDPTLNAAETLDPVARPRATREYVFQAFDTRGCPKPGLDTVVVAVLEKIIPSAGNDTTAVVGQPLQMKASGGTIYHWSPSLSLSATDIADPVATFSDAGEGFRFPYKVMISNEAGCVDSASVSVQVFATAPDVFVPNAFTPNGDGVNDFFRPLSAGVSRVEVFQVFNRWGQLVYSGAGTHSQGWDGNYKGKPMDSATFVWVLKAKDYTGMPIVKKGTVTLVR